MDSGEKTVTGISNLFVHPVDTIEGSVKGVGSVFNRAKEAVTSTPSQSEDSRLEQFIGFSNSKRGIANRMGVDVYSTNKTLQAELDMTDHNPMAEAATVSNAIEVVRWYQPQIYVKLMRAVLGKVEGEELAEKEGFPKDSDGSAKVALIGIDRSIAAWVMMLSLFPEKEDATFKNLVLLEKLRKMTEKEFPDARSFHRAGFDDAE